MVRAILPGMHKPRRIEEYLRNGVIRRAHFAAAAEIRSTENVRNERQVRRAVHWRGLSQGRIWPGCCPVPVLTPFDAIWWPGISTCSRVCATPRRSETCHGLPSADPRRCVLPDRTFFGFRLG
jgi:hypothetical protein